METTLTETGMLNLTRNPGEGMVLQTSDGEIFIYLDLEGHQIKVSVDAPEVVKVWRDEAHFTRDREGEG